MTRHRVTVLSIVGVLLLFSLSASAQTLTGRILGQVVGPDGAPMPGVTIVASSEAVMGGSRTAVTASNFPALEGMSLYKLSIEPGCFREPHWHPNADEMGYCTKGKVLVTVFSSGNRHDVFTISAGQMYLAPSGSFHAIENIGTEAAEIVAAFNHASPEDFGLSGSTGCFKP